MRRAERTRRGVGAREAAHQIPPPDTERFLEHRDWREHSTFVLNIRSLGPQDLHEAVCVRPQLAIAITNHDIVEIARKNSFGERGISLRTLRCSHPSVDAALESFDMWMKDLRANGRPDDPLRQRVK
jgi:hypothetical protein